MPGYTHLQIAQPILSRTILLAYFEMFKRYGGVPIVDFQFKFDDPESLKVPRATLEDTVNFIVKDAEAAAAFYLINGPHNIQAE